MAGHNDGTIAALLRHSGTVLVKRYAHLTPSHLDAAVESVAAFGKRKDEAIAQPTHSQESPSFSNETGSKTGTGEGRELGSSTKVFV